MLHNKGNTIPYYGEDFSGYATSLAYKTTLRYYDIVWYFLYFKLVHKKIIILLPIYYF